MTQRRDLLQLDADALAELSNRGLVKRAQKALDEGVVPELGLDESNALTATFEDGASCRLESGRSIHHSTCSCGATGICRHRVGAVLAYQLQVSAELSADGERTEVQPGGSWSPGNINDEALLSMLGAGVMQQARRLARSGFVAEVRSADGRGQCPSVRLETCNVRFLVRDALEHARCDCRTKAGCVHLALAVWSFRRKDELDQQAPSLVVAFGDLGDLRPGVDLESCLDVLRFILIEGIARLPEGSYRRLNVAIDEARKAGSTWVVLALEEIRALLERYRQRSALFDRAGFRRVAAELLARLRAGRGGGDVPARIALGQDVALATELDTVRLAGIGASLFGDGASPRVEVYLVDLGSRDVLVYEKHFAAEDFPGAADGPEIGRRVGAGRGMLSALASGQITATGVRRRANRAIRFGIGSLRKTTLTAETFDLGCLPRDRIIIDVATFLATCTGRPPSLLRPRHMAEDIHAVTIAHVERVSWDPVEQVVTVQGRDCSGAPIVVERTHRGISPGAIQTIATVIRQGALNRTVIGRVSPFQDGILVDAVAVLGKRLRVLDFDAPSAAGEQSLRELPVGSRVRHVSALRLLMDEVCCWAEDLVMAGLLGFSARDRRRAEELSMKLRNAGFLRLNEAMQELADAASRCAVGGEDAAADAAAGRWLEFNLQLELTLVCL